MSEASKNGSEFLKQVEGVILEQISNEQFGVSELADAMHMSRSNLLRRIKKETGLSASQFIRRVRLEKGKELLNESALTVSEVSYQVGFGSASYFVKCFREQYGYPPGEESQQPAKEEGAERSHEISTSRSRVTLWPYLLIGSILIISISFFLLRKDSKQNPGIQIEKSIAVLPFRNDSNDSSNLYFVNGLMESALSNLQKVKGLRVVSRTSVEQYRESKKTIDEIAEELGVGYLVEGSGQKVGDQVLLNIQLIEASTDKQLWAEQYDRKLEDIFELQNEVARQMTDAIKVFVTPEELEQIAKVPTENLKAYDLYLQAMVPFNTRTPEGLNAAIKLFKQAIEIDSRFALAYAKVAIAYHFLDSYRQEKQYTDYINNYADQALLHDSRLDESLIAKALYYQQVGEYRLSLPHLEKALEYNPNSSAVIQLLAQHYMLHDPKASKYLEYALKGIQIDIKANDSIANSYMFVHVGNAFLQSGFVDEAIKYIDRSLALEPNNYYAPYARALMLYSRDQDLDQTKSLLLREFKKDTNRLDLQQEIGKVYYYQRNYDSAFYYYHRFVQGRKDAGLELFTMENIKIAWVYQQLGKDAEAEQLLTAFKLFCQKDQSIYQGLNLALLNALLDNEQQVLEGLKKFSGQNDYQYWSIMFLQEDPIMEPFQDIPAFQRSMEQIQSNFWEQHEQLKLRLGESGLI